MLAGVLSGCSALLPLPAGQNATLRPQRSVEELLTERLERCGQEKALRAEKIRLLRTQLQQARKDNGLAIEPALDGLILLSCEPGATPGLMGDLINHLISMGPWPAQYDALFDLLRSEQRAIAQYNARLVESTRENAEMRQSLQTQKDELTKLQTSYKAAIKGIGEIEETLDSRTQKPTSPP